MGSLGDDDAPGEKVEDGEAGEAGELHFDDTVLIEDAYETQGLNFGGETQVLDDDDDDNAQSLEKEKIQCSSVCEQGDKGLVERPDALRGECCNTGSGQGFTSICAASLRASGLAASGRDFKGINSDSCLISTSSLSSDQHAIRDKGLKLKVVEEVDQFLELGKDIEKEAALNYVERFIQKNSFVLYDHEVDRRKITGGKLKPVSTFVGPQHLAKKVSDRNRVGETCIFDWDGGEEIFYRKKQELFNKDNEGQVDSRVTLNDIKKNEKEPEAGMKIKKSLVSELGEQFNIDSPSKQLEAVVTSNDVPEMLSVGPDTQMAAEAIEALICGDVIANHDVSGLESESNVSLEGSLRGNRKNRVSSNDPSSQKRACLSDGVTTRQSRRMKSTDAKLRKDSSDSLVKTSKNIRIELDKDLAISNMKRAKSSAEGHITTKRSKIVYKVPSKDIKQRKAQGASKPKEVNRCLKTAAQSGGHSIKKWKSNEEVSTLTPISSRTRHSILVNQLRRAEHALDENIAVSTDVEASELLHAKKKSKLNSSKPASNQSGELENGKPNEPEELFPKLIDALRYPKIRRSHRNLSGQDHGFDKLDAQSKPDFVQVKTVKHSEGKSVADPSPCAKNAETDGSLDKSPKNKYKASDSSYSSPGNCMTPVNAASPVCMGDEYYKQSCKKNLLRSGLLREISSLNAREPKPISPPQDLWKRKDMAEVRVLFSSHLDDDTIKQQKKILARLGASEATSITDATHFITDDFVRTRNMLEAIASSKPVVTHLWLESIGQVKIHMDEEAFLLRDSKKEKEFGFSMPVSLACACKHPLLQGQRVLITLNTKPGKETIARLVTAVHGQAIGRMGRSALKDGKVPDDLLILSCEEDYGICEPFLEKGVPVYSSELLLNGIVIQKLEYERHRLFVDRVKQTRSTIWLKKDGQKFHL